MHTFHRKNHRIVYILMACATLESHSTVQERKPSDFFYTYTKSLAHAPDGRVFVKKSAWDSTTGIYRKKKYALSTTGTKIAGMGKKSYYHTHRDPINKKILLSKIVPTREALQDAKCVDKKVQYAWNSFAKELPSIVSACLAPLAMLPGAMTFALPGSSLRAPKLPGHAYLNPLQKGPTYTWNVHMQMDKPVVALNKA